MSRPLANGWADRCDLTRPTKDLARENGVSTSAVTLARRVRGVPNPTPRPKPPPAPRKHPQAPPAPSRAPRPTPKPTATPIARQDRTLSRESAATVAPSEPIAANDLDAKIRQAVTDEVRVMGVSPFVASVVVSARYRVAREMVEAIAEDVAGMRRGVAHG